MVRRGRDAEPEVGSNKAPQGTLELIRGIMAEAMRVQAAAIQEQVTAMQEQTAAMQEQTAAMREQVVATAQLVRQAREEGCNNNRNQERAEGDSDRKGWKYFRKSSPPSFEGEYDPKKAMWWLKEMEKLFAIFDNTDAQKVSYGTYMLKGYAECWWKGAKGLMEARGTAVTWDSFKEAFLERYFPRHFRDQKEMDFLSIKQGDAPFEKFLAEYEDLAEYSSYLKVNPDERWKCMHFVNALNPKLNDRVAHLEITNFATIVNKCCLCNASMARLEKGAQQSDSHKRKQPVYAKGGEYRNDKGKKPKTLPSTGTACPKCGKSHGNKPCLAGTTNCYKCEKPGHIARYCPQVQRSAEVPRPSTQRRVYTLRGKEVTQSDDLIKGEAQEEIITAGSLQFDFESIKVATNDFSEANKLGQGGFGLVYKGRLFNGQEIAVKRLSRDSWQGDREFKNEVLLVAKLQHRNLVKLLGFCLQNRERLLVYEFVPNKSLDYFLFDPVNRGQLNWERRYKIIEGIARGLLYLHQDSQVRIVHRDLKASNILLNEEMIPKISDFGLARLFGVDQTQDSTTTIVGTYGYMAPEYIKHGRFSVKSDVFSFGVLLLEILSGQKNCEFRCGENAAHLLTVAWKNWREGTISKFLDPMLIEDSSDEITKCIYIALLCVQENEGERPTMSSIVPMLDSYTHTLSLPSEPAFYMSSTTSTAKAESEEKSSINEVSITEDYLR